ncbi:MAG: methyltransferase domain-containing protein, partial [Verrucomicrobia bacterium]|nr:methyltransferase domain-containing protein [Verrucomicrobiota bacterium]
MRCHQTTLEECELPDGIADGMLFSESFHHLVDEHLAARQAFRLLKPGGHLCISGESNWIHGNAQQAAFWDSEIDRALWHAGKSIYLGIPFRSPQA